MKSGQATKGDSPCRGCFLAGYPQISSTGSPGIPGNSQKWQQEEPHPISPLLPSCCPPWSSWCEEMCRKSGEFLRI